MALYNIWNEFRTVMENITGIKFNIAVNGNTNFNITINDYVVHTFSAITVEDFQQQLHTFKLIVTEKFFTYMDANICHS